MVQTVNSDAHALKELIPQALMLLKNVWNCQSGIWGWGWRESRLVILSNVILIVFHVRRDSFWYLRVTKEWRKERESDRDLRCCVVGDEIIPNIKQTAELTNTPAHTRTHTPTYTRFSLCMKFSSQGAGVLIKKFRFRDSGPTVSEIQAIFRVMMWILIHSMHRLKPDGSSTPSFSPQGCWVTGMDTHTHTPTHTQENMSNQMCSHFSGCRKTIIRELTRPPTHTQAHTHTDTYTSTCFISWVVSQHKFTQVTG